VSTSSEVYILTAGEVQSNAVSYSQDIATKLGGRSRHTYQLP
jgi:hypothetical protein